MTSIDTNIIFSVLDPDDANHSSARPLLQSEGERGALVLSPVVYAELMASSARDPILRFLREVAIEVLWEMPPRLWERAGEAFGEYSRERRKGKLPRRLIADFLIAAHAEHHRLDVLTLDDTVYRSVFFRLTVRP
jgi:predicted nucleic acid-binding protein